MSRRRPHLSTAPMAIASDGSAVVNAYQFAREDHLEAVVEAARATGLPVFVGVVVPARLVPRVLRDVDDALADVVGRLGPRLVRPRK